MDPDAGFAGIGFGFVLLYSALLLVVIASFWKVFEKAGRPGWYSLIPILNVYQLIQIAGRPGWWLLLLLVPLVNVIVAVVVAIDVARNFGRGSGFGLGLAFLPFIFYAILAFGDAAYRGAAPARA